MSILHDAYLVELITSLGVAGYSRWRPSSPATAPSLYTLSPAEADTEPSGLPFDSAMPDPGAWNGHKATCGQLLLPSITIGSVGADRPTS